MRTENISLMHVAIAVGFLALVNWAVLQFGIMPNMPPEQREVLYSGLPSSPYVYAMSLAFLVFAAWFVFYYRGRFSTHTRRIVVFGMACGTIGGMILIVAIRTVWHI